MGFKIMNLGQLWDILIKLVDSVEEFGWRVELVVINFCVILKTQGCKEISEKEGAGSEEQRSCLRDNTKERMISRETKRRESCKERGSHCQSCKKLQKWQKTQWDLATSVKFSFSLVNPDCRCSGVEWG